MNVRAVISLCAACAVCGPGFVRADGAVRDPGPVMNSLVSAAGTMPQAGTPATPGATPSAPEIDAAFRAQLDAIDRRTAQIQDLTARFEQRRHTAMLRAPIVSSGTVRVIGSRMRWDTLQPNASAMVVDDALLQIHFPDQKVLEIYPIEDRLAQLASSPLPRMRSILEHFTVARDEPHADLALAHLPIRLTPRAEELLEHIRSIRLAVDPEGGYVLRMEITDADDELTVLLLTEHRINTGITEESLTLIVPDDTRRVRPLDGRRDTPTDGTRDASAPDATRRE